MGIILHESNACNEALVLLDSKLQNISFNKTLSLCMSMLLDELHCESRYFIMHCLNPILLFAEQAANSCAHSVSNPPSNHRVTNHIAHVAVEQ